MRVILCALLVALAAGCSSQDYSKNMQVATAQSTVLVCTVAGLDEVSSDKYETTKATTIQVATDLVTFIETGALSSLPTSQVEAALLNKIAGTQYSSIGIQVVSTVMAFVKNRTVNTEVLPEFYKELVLNALKQVISSSKAHRYDWRRPDKNAVK